MPGRGMWWPRGVAALLVTAVLSRQCTGGYVAKSILCDDVEAICNQYGYETSNITECGDKEQKFLNPEICNCGLRCIKNLDEGESCSRASLTSYPNKLCGPGLECVLQDPSDATSSICSRNSAKKCIKEILQYEDDKVTGSLGPGRYKPNCDEYGYYAPRQCSASSTCYCVNKEGKRLFGEGPVAKADEMNCKCSVYWEDMWNKGLNLGMRCLPNGNFDSLQCIDNYCFCYNDTATSVSFGPFPSSMIEAITCFNPEIHVEWYLNPCHRAQEAWDIQGDANTIVVAETQRPSCSPDGYYAAVQREGNITYCVDMHGHRIEDYEMSIHDPENMTCHCPRRRKMMEDNGLNASKPKCCKNGRYYPWQTRGLQAYCVDQNGNQYNQSVPATNIDILDCYSAYPCSK